MTTDNPTPDVAKLREMWRDLESARKDWYGGSDEGGLVLWRRLSTRHERLSNALLDEATGVLPTLLEAWEERNHYRDHTRGPADGCRFCDDILAGHREALEPLLRGYEEDGGAQ